MPTQVEIALEQTLRGLPADKPFSTDEIVKRLKLPVPEESKKVYNQVLKIAPHCPAAAKAKGKAFVLYGRTVYPWEWTRLSEGDPFKTPQTLVPARQAESRLHRADPQAPTLVEADYAEIERRMLVLLERKWAGPTYGDFVPPLVDGPQVERPKHVQLDDCILCSEHKLCQDGICEDCGEGFAS